MDRFFAAHGRLDPTRLERILVHCDRKFHLGQNPVWRRQVVRYFKSLRANPELVRGWATTAGTRDHLCNSYERNIMVDHQGVARLCFSADFPGTLLRNPGDLGKFWEGAGATRAAMESCRRYCGISHSVRRENGTLKPQSSALQ